MSGRFERCSKFILNIIEDVVDIGRLLVQRDGLYEGVLDRLESPVLQDPGVSLLLILEK